MLERGGFFSSLAVFFLAFCLVPWPSPDPPSPLLPAAVKTRERRRGCTPCPGAGGSAGWGPAGRGRKAVPHEYSCPAGGCLGGLAAAAGPEGGPRGRCRGSSAAGSRLGVQGRRRRGQSRAVPPAPPALPAFRGANKNSGWFFFSPPKIIADRYENTYCTILGVGLGLVAVWVLDAGPRGLANRGTAFLSAKIMVYFRSMFLFLPFNFTFSGDSRNTEFSTRCCSFWVNASARGPKALCT